MINPHTITKDFESALCEYTGAPYAVAVNSCTMALFLALRYHAQRIGYLQAAHETILCPSHTYNSVPMQILSAGYRLKFYDSVWKGEYQLAPLPVYDSARRFTSGMFHKNTFQCLSFHSSKILGDSQGGAIIHDDEKADQWFRRARFDGRTEGVPPKDDKFTFGWHCYMSPDVAARLLWKLGTLPKHNDDLPNNEYADLSKQECFKNG